MPMRTMLLLLLVVLLLHTSDAQGSSAPSKLTIHATYKPSPPISDVPFNVTLSAIDTGLQFDNKVMFASLNETCSVVLNRTTSRCKTNVNSDEHAIDRNTCNFTITRNEIKKPDEYAYLWPLTEYKKVYLCVKDSQTDTILYKEELPLATIRVSPLYVRTEQKEPNVITFSDSTPINTAVGFSSAPNITPTSYVTLNSSRKATVDVSDWKNKSAIYVFTNISLGNGDTLPIIQYWLLGVQNYTTNESTVAVNGRQFTMYISGSSKYLLFMLSNVSDCSFTSQFFLSPASLPAKLTFQEKTNVSAGNYTLCVGGSNQPMFGSTGIEVQVSQYHFYPNRVYVGKQTTLQPYVENGVANSDIIYWVYVNSSGDCDDGLSDRSWTRSGGNYTFSEGSSPNTNKYCTRVAPGNSTKAYTEESTTTGGVTTFTPPNKLEITFAIRNAIASISAEGNTQPILLALVAGTSCDITAKHTLLVLSANEPSTQMFMPQSEEGSVTLCASVPLTEEQMKMNPEDLVKDRNIFLYSFASYTVDSYALYYDALVVNRSTTISFDKRINIPNYKIAFAPPGSECTKLDDTTPAYDVTKIDIVMRDFSEAGEWSVCIKSASDQPFQYLRKLLVNSLPKLSPRVILANVTAHVNVNNAPAMSNIILTNATECTPEAIAQKSTLSISGTSDESGNAQLDTCGAQSEQPLRLCVTYTGYERESNGTSKQISTMLDSGDSTSVRIKAFTIASDKVMSGENVRVYMDATSVQLPQKASACLMNDPSNEPSDCSTEVQVAQQQPYATFNLSITGTPYYLYVRSDSCKNNYTRSSNTVTALSPLKVTNAALITGVPGALTFNGSSATSAALKLTQFVLVGGNSKSCDDVTSITGLPSGTVSRSAMKTDEFVSSVIVANTASTYSVCFIVTYPLTAESGGEGAGHLTVYQSAGVISVSELVAKSAYAFRDRPNRFTFSPPLPSTIATRESTPLNLKTSFCLTPLVDLKESITSHCNSKPTCYETGPEKPLQPDISIQLYYVCVTVSTSDESWIVGAQRPVYVVSPWKLTLTTDTVRQYVPFNATLTCTVDPQSNCEGDVDNRAATPASQGSRDLSHSGDSMATYSASMQSTTSYKIYVRHASTSCYDISTGANDGTDVWPGESRKLLIEQPDAIANITFCLVINDVDVLPVLTTTLHSYLEPSVIVANEQTKYTAGIVSDDETGILTSDIDCKTSVTTSSSTKDMSFILRHCNGADFNGDVVYYCQCAKAKCTRRAVLPVLYRTGCASPKRQASIASVTALPGTRITNFGLSNSLSMTPKTEAGATSAGESVLTDPRLYNDNKCTDVVNESTTTSQASIGTEQPVYIFVPEAGEAKRFFVCARVRYATDSTPRFTTTDPTLSVANWSVKPQTALSPSTNVTPYTGETQLCITSAVHTESPFISDGPACKNNIVTASNFTVLKDGSDSDNGCGKGLPPPVKYALPNVSRFMYVCAYKRNSTQGNDSTNNDVVPIAKFLSLTAPTVTQYTPIIMRGAPFSATLSTPYEGGKPLYTMRGDDSALDTYAYFTNQKNRSVYLSADQCEHSLTTMTTVNDNNAVVINNVTWDSSEVQNDANLALCTYTPAGVAVARIIEKTNRIVWPAHYTTGTNASMYIPLYRNTPVVIVPGKDCSKIDSTLNGTTDKDGYVWVHLVNKKGDAVPTGSYTVCRVDNTNYVTMDTVTIDPVIYYDVRGTTFVTNVNGSVELLSDLTSDKLLPGFSISNTCGDDTLHKKSNWTNSSKSNKTIYVMGTEPVTGLHLCAKLPNGTVALPMAERSFTFASSTLTSAFNSTLNWCALPTFPSGCSAPGKATETLDTELVIISGDCCTARGSGGIDTASVLARNPMNKGECSMWQFGNATTASQPPPQDTMVSVCVWSNNDADYCPTIARVPLNTTNCANRDVAGGSSLLPGWLIAVIVLSIVIGLLLIALLIYLLCVFCCRPRRLGAAMDKDRQLVALRQMEASEYDYSMGADYYSVMGTNSGAGFGGSNWGTTGGVNTSSSAVGGSRHPLLYYPAAGGAAGFAGSDGDSSSSPTSASAMRGMAGSSVHHVHMHEQQDNVHGGGGSYSYHHQLQAANGTSLGMNTMTANASASMATRPSLVEGFEDEERDEVALQEARERYHMRVAFAEELERLRLLAKEAEVIVGYEDTDERLFGHAAPELRSIEVLDVGTAGVTLTQRQQRSMAHGGEGEAVVDVFAGGVDAQGGAHNDNDDDDAFAPLNFEHHNGLTRDSATCATGSGAATTVAARVRGGGGGGASDVDSDASVSQLARMLGGDGVAFNGNDDSNENNNAGAGTTTTATSQDKARARLSSSSPSSSGRHSHIHFDTAAQQSRNGGSDTTSRPLPSNNKDDNDDDDMDELSFTTTQRFYDEKRFLLEQEDIRRQRLSNWEDEERALLAQDELNDYMQVATTMTANDSGNTNNTSALTVEHAVTRTGNVDEVVYDAPHTPTQPPQLTNETVTAVEKAQHRSSRRRRSHHGGSRTSDGKRRSSRGSRSGGGGSTTLGSIDQLDEELYPEHNTL